MSSKHSARQLADMRPKAIAQAVAELQDGDYLLFAATPGLRLAAGKVQRSWIHRYRRPDGGIAQVRLGAWPGISYPEAAAQVADNNRQRDLGGDPARARDEARQQREQEIAAARARHYTVDDMIREYLRSPGVQKRSAKFAAEVERVIAKDILPKFGKRSATDITRAEATAWLLSLPRSIARLSRAELSAGFEHAVGTAQIDEEAVNVWEAARRNRTVRSHVKQGAPKTRFLNDSELAAWLSWLPESGMSRTVRDALELTLRLGARSGEIVGAKWSDIDLDRAQWHLPKTKTNQPRTIRLPKQAMAILRARSDLHDAFVFARPDGRAPVRQSSLGWQVVEHGGKSELAAWSAHDLRRSCRTGLSRIGCPGDVAEAALGHSAQGVIATYNQHSYEAEVGQWLQRWNDHLDGLAGAAVVPFKREAAS